MEPSIELLHLARGKPPRVVLHGDGMALSISWTEWQLLVHRASWLYMRWCAEYDVDLVNTVDKLAGPAAGVTLGHHDVGE